MTPLQMYQNILNFLFGKSKKTLSKKETDDLIRLIAQSIGLEEEYKDKTNDKSFIKKMLDEVVIEDNEFNLEEIFDFEEDSYEYPEDYEDQEEFERGKPLSKRKIKRKSVFRKENEGGVNEGRVEKVDEERVEVDERRVEDDSKVVEDKIENKDNKDSKINVNKDNKEDNIPFTLPTTHTPFSLPPSQHHTLTPFSIPSKIEDNDFPFDLGQLDSVKNTGPFYKFLDENGEDL